ncbi:MAG: histidine kinase [Leptolyngbyaceae cyanobacterium SL_7_1]|nr:histidine kinase [Leptolyngbyaceae cyanobacterium SL_7_1]
MNVPFPYNEEQRIAQLLTYGILDTEAETAYDDLIAIAAHICQMPIALVSLIDVDRQWFKSKLGIDAAETPRAWAFCAHAILSPNEVLIVSNALEDERFATNPLVAGDPHIRFYAGAPLVTADGLAMGTLCVIDRQPRVLSNEQIVALKALSRQVVSQLELRLSLTHLHQEMAERQRAEAEIRHLNAALEDRIRQRTMDLQQALDELKQTQAHLVNTEKMTSLGHLVAGVAHEINNPLSFVAGNVRYAQQYIEHLLSLLRLYKQEYPHPSSALQRKERDVELDYIVDDLPNLVASMKLGTDRIQEIVSSLRNFSRMDDVKCQPIDLHIGLDSTLMLLRYRLKAHAAYPEIQLIRDYGNLPLVTCYVGQLNQVFMNLLANAIDALEESYNSRQLEWTGSSNHPHEKYPTHQPTIRICTTAVDPHWVQISIADNGVGMDAAAHTHLFEPFFTTKPAGKGTGLGLSISHHIVTKVHKGQLRCHSHRGQGTEFIIQLPVLPQPLAIASAPPRLTVEQL